MNASLTAEAAMVLPLFLFTMVLLMMPMKIMDDSRKIQTKLETIGENLSQYAYLLEYPEHADAAVMDEPHPEGMTIWGGLERTAMLSYAEVMMRQFTKEMHLTRISFLKSRVLKDGETIDLVMEYQYRLPFSVLMISEIPLTARCVRRAWIGKTGGKNNYTGAEAEEEIVYVGRDSTRYHWDRGCHYLYNHIEAVSSEGVDDLRNQGGSKYHPCSRCARSGVGQSTVYVMPSGESFHFDRNCTAIVAYVRAVPLSEAAYLGPCSYCSAEKP